MKTTNVDEKKTYFDLLVEQDAYRHAYALARHSLIIYRNIVITVIFLIIGSITTIGIIGGNTYVETCCGFIIFFCAIFLIVLIVYFFTDGMDTGGDMDFTELVVSKSFSP